MSKTIYRYAITSGLVGCYMPDNGPWLAVGHTRRELASLIRAEVEARGFPAKAAREVKLTRLWAHIKEHGSSVAHFSIQHGAYEIAFHGLTEAEALEMEGEDA